MRVGAGCAPVLAQRAVSEDPRWTRAVGDQARPLSWRVVSELGGNIHTGGVVGL